MSGKDGGFCRRRRFELRRGMEVGRAFLVGPRSVCGKAAEKEKKEKKGLEGSRLKVLENRRPNPMKRPCKDMAYPPPPPFPPPPPQNHSSPLLPLPPLPLPFPHLARGASPRPPLLPLPFPPRTPPHIWPPRGLTPASHAGSHWNS